MSYEKIPFCAEEMQSGDIYSLPFPGFPGIKKPNYPISVKENIERTLKGEPAWLAADIEFAIFAPTLIPENKARGMVIDVERVPREEMGGKDFFGIDWEFVPTANGSMVRPGKPLLEDASEWKEKVVFPDISTWDWAGSAARNKPLISTGRPTKMIIYTGFFERLISFMDMEGALVAMIDEDQQEDVKELFDHLTEFYIELIGYMKKYYNFDVLWFHDDWGSQRAPMFSYDTVEEMILPYLKRVADACHELGVILEFHSCGMIEPLVPLMVEAGVDMWDGQNMNNKAKLSKEYKGRLTIEVEGTTNPSMTDDDIRAYVNDILDNYDKGIFLAKTFRNDPRLFPIAYEESRKRYSV